MTRSCVCWLVAEQLPQNVGRITEWIRERLDALRSLGGAFLGGIYAVSGRIVVSAATNFLAYAWSDERRMSAGGDLLCDPGN